MTIYISLRQIFTAIMTVVFLYCAYISNAYLEDVKSLVLMIVFICLSYVSFCDTIDQAVIYFDDDDEDFDDDDDQSAA